MYYSNQAKRQLSRDMSWEDQTKKLRTSNENKLITCIEDLSNELIYEIFEYFHAEEIFNQFTNLNQRFENLVLYSNLPLKVHYSFGSSFEFTHHRVILPNKHRILSFNLWSQFQSITIFILHTIDSSFSRLESLIFHEISTKEFVSFLPNLIVLPRLFSLEISFDDTLNNDFNEIYSSIFQLPKLKYNKLTSKHLTFNCLKPRTVNEQFSSIEYLVIDHPCTVENLYSILSYTPNLRRLSNSHLFQHEENIFSNISLKLFNLTHCIIHQCYFGFDQFEILIKKFSSQLRVLRLTGALDVLYLDADRWERLISKHIPYLHTFQLKCSYNRLDHFQYQPNYPFIHRFTSPFWIDKGWMRSIETDATNWSSADFIYSIQPYKKQWYENGSIQFREQKSMKVSKTMYELIIRNYYFEEKYDQSFIDYIQSICSLAEITSLYIEINMASIDMFVQSLHLLSNLDSLTIVFTVPYLIKSLTFDQIKLIHTASKMNKITKLSIEQLFVSNEIDIFINLCPQLKCLQVQCQNNCDIKFIVRSILTNKKSSLALIYFRIEEFDDSTVKTLQTMIYSEKLLVNYTIQHINHGIILYW